MAKEQVQTVAETQEQTTPTETNEKFRWKRFGDIVVVPDVELTRSEYDIKGVQYWQYELTVEIFGKKQKINLVAGNVKGREGTYRDKDIYELLDNCFALYKNIHFGIKSEKDISGSQKISYFVIGDSGDGITSVVPIRIVRMSSLSLLGTYLSIVAKKYDTTFPISIF